MNKHLERNRYMLKGKTEKLGYDWWWHNLIGVSRDTKERVPFFIQYMIVNPKISPNKVILPQTKKDEGKLPSYALMRVGKWGIDKQHIVKFYPSSEFKADRRIMDVTIRNNAATETHLKGSVTVTKEELSEYTEYNSDYGSMSWDLEVNKVLSWSVGYGASRLLCRLNAFKMYWHIGGMKTLYSGTITLNGKVYDINEDTSHGYQDKNWGQDYTNPWIWIGCNNFTSTKTKKELPLTSLDIGGGAPVIFGHKLKGRLLVSFYYEGKLYEYNFSKFWTNSKERFSYFETDSLITWNVEATNKSSKIIIEFTCKKEEMIKLDPEGCRGTREHKDLHNGGTGIGTVKLYSKEKGIYKLLDTFIGTEAGCELGK